MAHHNVINAPPGASPPVIDRKKAAEISFSDGAEILHNQDVNNLRKHQTHTNCEQLTNLQNAEERNPNKQKTIEQLIGQMNANYI